MAKIAILDDSPEVVAVLSQAVSPGQHAIMKMVHESQFMLDSAIAFAPDIIIVPVHRSLDSRNRPISDFRQEIKGVEVLELVCGSPELAGRPLILFGFYITPEDLPESIASKSCHNYFLTFPLGLQELNPLITGLVTHHVPPDEETGDRP